MFVERDRAALAALQRNVSVTGTTSAARVVAGEVRAFLAGPPDPAAPFDLVLCDPPYGVETAELDQILMPLATRAWTAANAIVVVERPAGSVSPQVDGLRITWERGFGDTLVLFLST